jgi:predicted 2-oxoglutarate/Fe(II)-dependent dioxygenase YbiX
MKFFIRVLFLFILASYFISQAAPGEDESTPLPTSLFRIQTSNEAPVYVLGSIHTKKRETYPKVVHETVRQIHQSGGHLFTEVLLEDDLTQVTRVLQQFSIETFSEGLNASALLHGKEKEIMDQWAEIYKNLIQTQCPHIEETLKNLLLTHVPHPLFVSYLLELEEGSPSEAAQQGIDYHISELFSKENKYSLESQDARLSLALEEDHLRNFLMFEDTVKNLSAQASQIQSDAPSSVKAEVPEAKEEVVEESEQWYRLFLANPLYKVSTPEFATLEERNQLWRTKLDEVLSDPHHKRPLLLVTGAFHLGGPTGLLEYFHQKGMSLFQIHEGKEHQCIEREFVVDPALFSSPPPLS